MLVLLSLDYCSSLIFNTPASTFPPHPGDPSAARMDTSSESPTLLLGNGVFEALISSEQYFDAELTAAELSFSSAFSINLSDLGGEEPEDDSLSGLDGVVFSDFVLIPGIGIANHQTTQTMWNLMTILSCCPMLVSYQ